ncbi:MAG: HAMP domain-containing histidine kinase [Brumimicrobium sp.]|nr:HAMP domain-containing histidine kinase [Brumimicrobium sp.]
MRIFRIKHIVFLTSVALLVLVSLQLYQVFQLYDKKSEEFNTHINNILGKIAIRHEKASDLQRYSAFFGKDFRGQYKQALKQEFQNLLPVKESVSIRDTFIYEDGRRVKYLQITGETYDSISHLSANHSVLVRDISEMASYIRKGGITSSADSSNIAYQLDRRVMNSLFKKSKYINDIMISVFHDFNQVTANDRINLAFLDSIVAQTFEEEELDTKYSYVIYDENNEAVEFPSYTDKYNLKIIKEKAERIKLFPGNVFDEELMLYVYFPQRNFVLFHEIWPALTVSFLLVILIVLSFYVLFRAVIEERKLAEAKNDLISNMTHEFKTPISTISLACEAMKDGDMNKGDMSSVSPFITMIEEENKRLQGLVDQILRSAILDRGKFNLKKTQLELNEIVSNGVTKAKMRISNGTLKMELEPGMLPFMGDAVHTSNIIANLIDNAIKYSKETIDILVKTQKLSNGDYKFSVIDKGIGIKHEHIDKIFDKLYRVPTGNVHNVKGYGLGLNYVKTIVEKSEWDIHAYSKYGEGTTFEVIIRNVERK